MDTVLTRKFLCPNRSCTRCSSTPLAGPTTCSGGSSCIHWWPISSICSSNWKAERPSKNQSHNLPRTIFFLKSGRLAAGMKKLHKFQDTYEYLTTHSFYFHIEKRYKMLKKMSFNDRKMFNFNIMELNWHDYFEQQMRGQRIYIGKDPMSTVPEAIKRKKRLRNMFVISLIAITILVYGLGKILLFWLLPLVFAGVAYLLRTLVCWRLQCSVKQTWGQLVITCKINKLLK